MARELRAKVEDLLRLRVARDDLRAAAEAAPLEIGVDDIELGRVDLRDVDRGDPVGFRLVERDACPRELLELALARRDDPLDHRPLGVERDLDRNALVERFLEEARDSSLAAAFSGSDEDALPFVEEVLLSLVLSFANGGDGDQVGFAAVCHGVSPRGCARLRADDRTCQPERSRARGARPPSAGRQKLCSARRAVCLLCRPVISAPLGPDAIRNLAEPFRQRLSCDGRVAGLEQPQHGPRAAAQLGRGGSRFPRRRPAPAP